ncbi:MAG: hypothetical protein JWL70_49 [Acidimicrobiia bacterium]|nr:hypothetical protein [Acidimicrobiia bacterium]
MSYQPDVEPRSFTAPEVDVRENRSVGELFKEFTTDISTLMRKEIELARIELKDEVAKGARAGGMLGATALAGYMALLMASFAAAWGLAEVMPTGWAFLIVAVVYGIVAAVLYSRGRRELRQMQLKPEQTIQTLKEDVQWAKQQKK